MEEIHDEDNPKYLIDKVSSCMLCFGLYRRSERLQTDTQDVTLDFTDDADANFPHPSKRNAEDFSSNTPGYVKPTFRKHVVQLSQKADKNLGF